jgi:hypothetical protein
MFAGRSKDAAQIDQTGTVELQGDYRGSPRRRHAHDQRAVYVPGKVLLPALQARVKQGHLFLPGCGE